MPKKTKTGLFQIRTTSEDGSRKKKSFATWHEAVYAENAERARVVEVRRGLRAALPPPKTFRELADYWLENRATQKRSGGHDRSILRAHLVPAFGDKLVSDIGVADVDRFMCDRLHLNKKTVHNLVTLLISMLNAAKDLGWLEKVPRIRKPKLRLFDSDFRYLRDADEIARFLRAALEEGPLVHALYAMALFTGLRAGELAGLTWPKIDFVKRHIIVERSFEGPTKSGDVRYVPILDVLLPILRAWRLQCPGAFVFPTRDGTMYGRAGRIFQEVFHRVLDAAGFPKVTVGARVRRHIRFHDLRHSFASHWMMNGGDLFKLQRILGHASSTMTQRYAHLAPHAFVGDYSRLGTATPPTGGVVEPLRPNTALANSKT